MFRKSEKEIAEILKRTKATLAVEGLELTIAEEELLKARHRGEISQAEFLKGASVLAKNV